MKLKKYLLILFLFILYSCSQNEDSMTNKSQAGVVISFDDTFVNEWYDLHNALAKYDWKATFFVTKFNQLSTDEISKLKSLENYGHEIGGHGLNHLNAPNFIKDNGTVAYLNQEIYPMLDLMKASSFYPTSFAYPYGARNSTSDDILLQQFQTLRGTTYGETPPSLQNCYYKNERIIYALGIDKSYKHSTEYLLSLLKYAKDNNKIVIFYGHKPIETSTQDYETEYKTITSICEFVKTQNMKFYKTSELHNLYL